MGKCQFKEFTVFLSNSSGFHFLTGAWYHLGKVLSKASMSWSLGPFRIWSKPDGK